MQTSGANFLARKLNFVTFFHRESADRPARGRARCSDSVPQWHRERAARRPAGHTVRQRLELRTRARTRPAHNTRRPAGQPKSERLIRRIIINCPPLGRLPVAPGGGGGGCGCKDDNRHGGRLMLRAPTCLAELASRRQQTNEFSFHYTRPLC